MSVHAAAAARHVSLTCPSLLQSLAHPLLLLLLLALQSLWVGPGSRAAQDKAAFESSFGPFYRVAQIIISTTHNSKSNYSSTTGMPSIVTDENIRLMFDMQYLVDSLKGECVRVGCCCTAAAVLLCSCSTAGSITVAWLCSCKDLGITLYGAVLARLALNSESIQMLLSTCLS
jgi:hypothetical protein